MNSQIKRFAMLQMVLSGLLALNVRADAWWNAGTGVWNEPGNWADGVVPTADDTVWATNLADNAVGPYEIRVPDGVAADCKYLNFETSNGSWTSAPRMEVESNGVLKVATQVNLNAHSVLHTHKGGEFNVGTLQVGLKGGTYGIKGAGAFVNDGKTVMTTVNMQSNGSITNNGDWAVGYFQIGSDNGGGAVVQTGGALSISKECSLANGGSGTYSISLTVSGGVVTNSGYMRVAYIDRNRSNTHVTITGRGTRWINKDTGTAKDNGSWFGQYKSANLLTNGWLVVANEAYFENACSMRFGRMAGPADNQLIEAFVAVTNRATFVCLNNVTLSDIDNISQNGVGRVKMLVDGAEAYVTNKTGTAALKLGTPMLEGGTSTATGTVEVRNGALVFCDKLTADNGAQSVANIVSGTLRAKNAAVDGESVQVVGAAGETGGEWRLGAGGVNSFAKGLTVKAGATLGVEIAASDSCGFADVSGQTLTFEQGAKLAVTLTGGFEPAKHQTWTVAKAASIVGLPKPARGWRVSKATADDGETLVLEKVTPSGLMIVIL